MEVKKLVVADTDFLSHYLKGDLLTKKYVEEMLSRDYLFTTTSITTSELLFGAYKKGWKRIKINELKKFLSMIGVISFNYTHSKIYGKLRADLNKNGIEIGYADTAIASICLGENLQLFTYNKKHFNEIDNLQLFS